MKYLMPCALANSRRSLSAPASVPNVLPIGPPFLMSCPLPGSEGALPRNPGRAGEGNARHGRRLDRQRTQIFRLQIVEMILAAGTCNRLCLERHDLEEVGQPPAGCDRIDTLHQLGILSGDAGRIAALVP